MFSQDDLIASGSFHLDANLQELSGKNHQQTTKEDSEVGNIRI